MVLLGSGLRLEREVEDTLLDGAAGLNLAEDTLADNLPDLRNTDHDGLLSQQSWPGTTYRTSLHNVRLGLANRRVGEGLDTAVGDGETSEEEGHLDDKLENMGKRKEGEVGVVGSEVLVQELPDGAD